VEYHDLSHVTYCSKIITSYCTAEIETTHALTFQFYGRVRSSKLIQISRYSQRTGSKEHLQKLFVASRILHQQIVEVFADSVVPGADAYFEGP
jgi:hypothetical protein